MAITNPITDIKSMLEHYGFRPEQLTADRLAFRFSLLEEEFQELHTARTTQNSEEVVDALVDIVVIALGTLELAGVDVDRAWREVHRANMSKIRGAKPGRPSDGWDLYKPLNWSAPSHDGNHGNLPNLLTEKTR